METATLSKREQMVLIDLMCFLFENENTLRGIYKKIMMNDTFYYISKKEEKKPLKFD